MRRFLLVPALFVLLGVSCNCLSATSSASSRPSHPQKVQTEPAYESSVYASRLTEHRYKVTMRLEKFCPKGQFFYGTGVIVSSDKVITAKHIVECPDGGDSVYIVGHRSDGKKVKLKPYWKAGYHDVAVLHATSWLNGPRRAKVDLGEHAIIDRTKLKIGDWLCYVGGGARVQVVLTKCGEVYESSPLEFAVGLHVFGGNSGGPLFNKEGKLVGIMYGKHEEDLEGYAVPITAVPEVLPKPKFGPPLEKKKAPKTRKSPTPLFR